MSTDTRENNIYGTHMSFPPEIDIAEVLHNLAQMPQP